MAHVGINIQQNMFEDMAIKSSSENLDKNGFIMLFKDLFGKLENDKFPKNFDAWTVQKQYDWLNENIGTFFPNIPQSLLNLISAAFCQLDYNRSLEELPEWMDIDKYHKGQKFVQKHYFAVVVTNLISVLYIYSFDEASRGVILGEHNHTPYLGFQKSLGTIKRLFTWYNGNIWIKGSKAYQNMQTVRRMHVAIRKKVCQMDHEQIAAACTFAHPWCPDREMLLKDFAAACPPEKFGQRPYIIFKNSSYKPKNVNNADFAGVQSCFVALPLVSPQNIGIHNATDEDLEAYCHMWRCYGYFLGIEDEYNFCRGSVDEIKQRIRDFYQYWIIQNLKEVTPEWEHATRCLIVPVNYFPLVYMSYKVMLLIATDALNLSMPRLYASFNYKEWIMYKIYKLIFYAMKFSVVRIIANKIVRKIIDEAANYNMEKLTEIHEKSKKLVPDFSLM